MSADKKSIADYIADYIADNMPDRKHSLSEIDLYVRKIEINAAMVAPPAIDAAVALSAEQALQMAVNALHYSHDLEEGSRKVRALLSDTRAGDCGADAASPAIDAAPDNSQYFNAREVIAAMILEHEDGGLTAGTIQRGLDICYSPLTIPNAAERCDMGVGCEEAGVCFANANGEPDRCPKNAIDAAGASEGDVREGYVLAPIEPTEEILMAIFRNERDSRRAWRDVIAALAKENGDE